MTDYVTRLDEKIVEYDEIRLIKQSEKNTIQLVREKGGEQVFIRKILQGQHPIYLTLQNCQHLYLPKLYDALAERGNPPALPAPYNPHWDGETGIGVWGNVSGSGVGNGEPSYHVKVYRRDTATPPDLNQDMWEFEYTVRGRMLVESDTFLCRSNFSKSFTENGYYYFAVAASGDETHYADSPYVISDAFWYTGKSAQMLPAPTEPEWKFDGHGQCYAGWSNWEDYEDQDEFYIYVYDQDAHYIMCNGMTKEQEYRI